MEAKTYEEFIDMSYSPVNIGSEILFEGVPYTLIQYGIREAPTYSYANQMNEQFPRTPQWTIQLKERTLTITNLI